jgi:hypothetical protein
MAKIDNKRSIFVSSAIVDKLKLMIAKVKTLTFETAKSSELTPILINSFKAQIT